MIKKVRIVSDLGRWDLSRVLVVVKKAALLNGKSQAWAAGKASCPPCVPAAPSGSRHEGDLVSEGFELADEVAGLAFRVQPSGESPAPDRRHPQSSTGKEVTPSSLQRIDFTGPLRGTLLCTFSHSVW